MDIAAYSIANSLNQVQTSVNVSLLKQVMNDSTTSIQSVLEGLDVGTSATLGTNIDITA